MNYAIFKIQDILKKMTNVHRTWGIKGWPILLRPRKARSSSFIRFAFPKVTQFFLRKTSCSLLFAAGSTTEEPKSSSTRAHRIWDNELISSIIIDDISKILERADGYFGNGVDVVAIVGVTCHELLLKHCLVPMASSSSRTTVSLYRRTRPWTTASDFLPGITAVNTSI